MPDTDPIKTDTASSGRRLPPPRQLKPLASLWPYIGRYPVMLAVAGVALVASAAVMLAGLLLALPLPGRLEPGTSSFLFPYLLVGLGFLVGIPVYHAIEQPQPKHVQQAVKRALIGLVVLDAVLATALAGTVGLVILLLVPPVLYLGRWLYST